MPQISESRLVKIFDIASYVILLLSIAIVPLLIDKSLLNYFVLPKQYIFMGLVCLQLLLFAGRAVLSKKFVFKFSIIDIPILAILVFILISSLFSSSLFDSFMGRNEFFTFNFIFALFLALFYFILVNHLNTAARWRAALETLLAVGGITALMFVARAVFHIEIPFLKDIYNLIDSTNSLFGLWLIVIFTLSAGLLIKKNLGVGRALSYFFVMILSFTVLTLLNFKSLWWLMLASLILLLLLGISLIKKARTGWLSVLFTSLIIVVIAIIFGIPKSVQTAVPVEIGLGSGPSFTIAYKTMFSGAKSFLFGSGPGTFGIDFSKFRSSDFNYNDLTWSLRFSQPFSSFFAIMSEGGITFVLSMLLVLFLVLGHVLHTWLKERGSDLVQNIAASLRLASVDIHFDVFLAAVAWIVLWIGMFTNFYGPTLWWLWWLLLGLIISGLGLLGHGVVKEKEFAIEDTPQYNLTFSFALIVVMATVIMVGVLGARFYMADKEYVAALNSANYKEAETRLKDVLQKRNNLDTYHVSLAKVYLMQAAEATQKGDKVDVMAVADLLAKAVNEAKTATDLSPNSVSIWENLATMYENASLVVPEAREWTIKSLNTAKDLESSNAILWWRLGNNYVAGKDLTKAAESYQKAIDLKTNYVGAYMSLADVHEQNKQADKAIELYQRILSSALDNQEVLFNFGRLLYNRRQTDDMKNAEALWLESVRLQPNYSNALFALGMLYETNGDKSKALQYYYKVKDLNPDNKDVSAKIRSLIGVSEPVETEKK